MKPRRFALLSVIAVSMGACGGNQTSSAAGGAGTDACGAGKTAYQKHREEVLAKAAQSACSTDADCAVLYEGNACVQTCGTAVAASASDSVTADLNDFAKKNCGSCAPIPVPPCAPPAPLTCQQGRCGGP
jgi:hypothetical protein